MQYKLAKGFGLDMDFLQSVYMKNLQIIAKEQFIATAQHAHID